MTIFLGANNAAAAITSSIAPGDTVIQLAPGKGALFPNPSGGAVFAGTLADPAGIITEVVYCTAKSADTLTVERAQENTDAVTWPAGTVLQNLITDGTLLALAQWDQLTPFLSVDLGNSGSASFDISTYSYKPGRIVARVQAEVPTQLTNIIGGWAGAQVTLVVAEGSQDISIPVDTPPFFIANTSGPLGWPGYPNDSITLLYVPQNASYKWVEMARNWRTS